MATVNWDEVLADVPDQKPDWDNLLADVPAAGPKYQNDTLEKKPVKTGPKPSPAPKPKPTEAKTAPSPAKPKPAAAAFDPEGPDYDYETAKAAGLGPDETGHWPSRDPKSGVLLKGRKHETWDLLVQGEQEANHWITKGEDGRYYSQPKPEGRSLDFEGETYNFPPEMDDASIERWFDKKLADRRELSPEDASGRSLHIDSDAHADLRRETPLGEQARAEYAEMFGLEPDELSPRLLENIIGYRRTREEEAKTNPTINPAKLREHIEDTDAMERDLDRNWDNETTDEWYGRHLDRTYRPSELQALAEARGVTDEDDPRSVTARRNLIEWKLDQRTPEEVVRDRNIRTSREGYFQRRDVGIANPGVRTIAEGEDGDYDWGKVAVGQRFLDENGQWYRKAGPDRDDRIPMTKDEVVAASRKDIRQANDVAARLIATSDREEQLQILNEVRRDQYDLVVHAAVEQLREATDDGGSVADTNIFTRNAVALVEGFWDMGEAAVEQTGWFGDNEEIRALHKIKGYAKQRMTAPQEDDAWLTSLSLQTSRMIGPLVGMARGGQWTAGAGMGAMPGVIAASYPMTQRDSYAAMRDAGVDEQTALVYSRGAGLVVGSIESMVPDVFEQGPSNTAKQALMRFMVRYFTETVIEEGGQAATEEIFKVWSTWADEHAPDLDMDEVGPKVMEAIEESWAPMLLIMGPGMMRDVAQTTIIDQETRDRQRIGGFADKLENNERISREDAAAWERVTGQTLPEGRKARTKAIREKYEKAERLLAEAEKREQTRRMDEMDAMDDTAIPPEPTSRREWLEQNRDRVKPPAETLTDEDILPESEDSGPSVQDSGPSVQDSGPSVQDSGPSVQDSGPSVQDSGPSVQDSEQSEQSAEQSAEQSEQSAEQSAEQSEQSAEQSAEQSDVELGDDDRLSPEEQAEVDAHREAPTNFQLPEIDGKESPTFEDMDDMEDNVDLLYEPEEIEQLSQDENVPEPIRERLAAISADIQASMAEAEAESGSEEAAPEQAAPPSSDDFRHFSEENLPTHDDIDAMTEALDTKLDEANAIAEAWLEDHGLEPDVTKNRHHLPHQMQKMFQDLSGVSMGGVVHERLEAVEKGHKRGSPKKVMESVEAALEALDLDLYQDKYQPLQDPEMPNTEHRQDEHGRRVTNYHQTEDGFNVGLQYTAGKTRTEMQDGKLVEVEKNVGEAPNYWIARKSVELDGETYKLQGHGETMEEALEDARQREKGLRERHEENLNREWTREELEGWVNDKTRSGRDRMRRIAEARGIEGARTKRYKTLVEAILQDQKARGEQAKQAKETKWETETRHELEKSPLLKDATIEVSEKDWSAKITRPDGRTTTIHFHADKQAPEKWAKLARKKGRKPEHIRGAYVFKKGAKGSFTEGDIYLASGVTHSTLNHEIVHWLEDEGVITPEEVAANGGREGIAHAYGEWAEKHVAMKEEGTTPVNKLFNRIYEFLEPIFSSQARFFRDVGERGKPQPGYNPPAEGSAKVPPKKGGFGKFNVMFYREGTGWQPWGGKPLTQQQDIYWAARTLVKEYPDAPWKLTDEVGNEIDARKFFAGIRKDLKPFLRLEGEPAPKTFEPEVDDLDAARSMSEYMQAVDGEGFARFMQDRKPGSPNILEVVAQNLEHQKLRMGRDVKNSAKPGTFAWIPTPYGEPALLRLEQRKGKQQRWVVVDSPTLQSIGNIVKIHADDNIGLLRGAAKADIPQGLPQIRPGDEWRVSKKEWEDYRNTLDGPDPTPQPLDRPRRVVIVGCCDKKLPKKAKAKDLYQSQLYQSARAYAEKHGDDWLIASAKYGTIDPDREIEPYNKKLGKSADERRRASGMMNLSGYFFNHPELMEMRGGFKRVRKGSVKVVILAGKEYAEAIKAGLKGVDVEIETPMEGMAIGQRLKWLKEETAKPREEEVAQEAAKEVPADLGHEAVVNMWLDGMDAETRSFYGSRQSLVAAMRRLVKRFHKGNDWKTLDDLTVKDRRGRKQFRSTGQNIKELQDLGVVQVAWDKSGTPHYALADRKVPANFVTDETWFEKESDWWETLAGDKYKSAHEKRWGSGEPDVFPVPDKPVKKKPRKTVSQAEAKKTVGEWKKRAKEVGKEEDNSNKVVFSLFDRTGVWSQPWRDAGYTVIQYDAVEGDDLMDFFPVGDIMDMHEKGYEIVGVLAAPPCTTMASSGARWWATRHDVPNEPDLIRLFGSKALQSFDTPHDYNVQLIENTALFVEMAAPQWYAAENPRGRAGKYFRDDDGSLPATMVFQPHHYGDAYTKETHLWGEFDTGLPTANVAPVEGSKIHKMTSSNPMRSETPEGFAYAFFMANHPTAAGPKSQSDTSGKKPPKKKRKKHRRRTWNKEELAAMQEQAEKEAREYAAEHDLDPDDFVDAAQEALEPMHKQWEARRAAKRDAHKTLGLDQETMDRIASEDMASYDPKLVGPVTAKKLEAFEEVSGEVFKRHRAVLSDAEAARQESGSDVERAQSGEIVPDEAPRQVWELLVEQPQYNPPLMNHPRVLKEAAKRLEAAQVEEDAGGFPWEAGPTTLGEFVEKAVEAGWTKDEAVASAALVTARAEVMGLTPDAWIAGKIEAVLNEDPSLGQLFQRQLQADGVNEEALVEYIEQEYADDYMDEYIDEVLGYIQSIKDVGPGKSTVRGNLKTLLSVDVSSNCPLKKAGRPCLYCYVEQPRTRHLLRLQVNPDEKPKRVNKSFEAAPYMNNILAMDERLVNFLNERMGGLRVYSIGDFQDSDIRTLDRVVKHAKQVGLKLKVITKSEACIEHLRGQKHVSINYSTDFAYPDALAKGPRVSNPKALEELLSDPETHGLISNSMSLDKAHKKFGRRKNVNIRYMAFGLADAIKAVADPRVAVVTLYHGMTDPNKLLAVWRIQNKDQMKKLGPKKARMLAEMFQEKQPGPFIPNITQKDLDNVLGRGVMKLAEFEEKARGKLCCQTGKCARCPVCCGWARGRQNEVLAQLLNGEPASSVEFVEDGKAIIRAGEGANASSLPHELAHVFRKTLTPEELGWFDDWATEGTGEWNEDAEEKFARGFEKYLREGRAPSKGLKGVFEKFAAWLRSIYRTLKGSDIDVNLTPQIRKAFDMILIGQERAAARDHLEEEQGGYRILGPTEVPKKTMVAYKLMKRRKDAKGSLFPLFVSHTEGEFVPGKWYAAEVKEPYIGKKSMAHRPGLHAVDLPIFAQGKPNAVGQDRVWVEVEMPAISEETQAESDASDTLPNGSKKGITERLIGPREAYNYKTNANARGASIWPIAGSMRVVRVLSDQDVETILRDAGKEEYIDTSLSGESAEAAQAWNDMFAAKQAEGQRNIFGEIEAEQQAPTISEGSRGKQQSLFDKGGLPGQKNLFADAGVPDDMVQAPPYPLAEKGTWYGDEDYEARGGQMVEMTPDEYLERVRPLDIDEESRENIDLLKEHIREGKPLDPLAIYEDGKEDGRHRAMAAKELGIAKVPVLDFTPKDPPKSETAKRAKQARKEAMDALDEFSDVIKDVGLGINQPLNPRVVLAAEKLTRKLVRAGFFTFAEFMEAVAKKLGKKAADEHKELFKQKWIEYWETGEVPEMQSFTEEEVQPKRKESANRDGGGQPREPGESFGGTTGTKNAATDAMRARLGLGERPDIDPETIDEWDEQAMHAMRAEPGLGYKTVGEILSRGKTSIDEVEHMVLGRHIQSLENRRATEDVTDEIVQAVMAAEQAGTTWGRTGVSRKMERYADYSFAGLVHQHVRETGRAPTDEEVETYEEVAERAKKAEEALKEQEQKHVEEKLDQMQEEFEKKQKKKPKKGSPKEKIKSKINEKLAVFKDIWRSLSQAHAVYDPKREAEKWAKLIKTAREIVAAYIELGTYSFLEMMADVKAQFGEVSDTEEEAFREVWDEAKARGRIESPLGPKPTDPEIAEVAKDLFEWAVATNPGASRTRLISIVQGELAEMGVEYNRYDTMKAMSGYGEFTPLPDDPVKKKVRGLRGEIQALLKLRDMKGGIAPQASGLQGPEATPEKRKLEKLVNEAKKAGGYVTIDPEKALKSALGSAKTAIRNVIEDLTAQIKDLEDAIKNKQPKKVKDPRVPPTDAELDFLKAQRDDLRARRNTLQKEYETLFPKKRTGLTDAAKLRLLESSLARALAQLEADEKAGRLAPEKAPPGPTSPKAEALKEKIREAKERRAERRKKDPKYQAKRDAARLKALETALEKEEAKLEAAAAAGDLGSPRPSRTPGVTSKTVERRRERIKQLKEAREEARKADPKYQAELEQYHEDQYLASLQSRAEFWERRLADARAGKKPPRRRMPPTNAAIVQAQTRVEEIRAEAQHVIRQIKRSERPTIQKVAELVPESLNTLRALRTSFDLSAVLRQGGVLSAAHPMISSEAFMPMLKAAASEEGQLQAIAMIKNLPSAKLAQQAGLDITTDAGKLSEMEEAYMSRLASKIPGVKHSERAYMTFLNVQRALVFDALVDKLGASGSVTEAEAKVLANWVNVASGRGNMGAAQSAAAAAATFFFAPRYVLSRFQLLIGQPLWTGVWRGDGGGRARALVLQEYGRLGAGLSVFYGSAFMAAAYLLGGDDEEEMTISFDWRSSDFGKLKFGETRIDPLAGLSQSAVLVGRLFNRTLVNSEGEERALAGDEVQYGGATIPSVLGRFIRSKLSPAFGTGLDILAGENLVGEEATAETELVPFKDWRRPLAAATPLIWEDVADAIEAQGVTRGTALGIAAILGMSSQTYGERISYQRADKDKRSELFDKYLENMTWDNPVPGFRDMLTSDQRAQVDARREYKRQSAVYTALEPKPSETATERFKEMKRVTSHAEAQQLLVDYYRRVDKKTGKPGSEYDRSTKKKGDTKESYRRRGKALADLYGKDFWEWRRNR